MSSGVQQRPPPWQGDTANSRSRLRSPLAPNSGHDSTAPANNDSSSRQQTPAGQQLGDGWQGSKQFYRQDSKHPLSRGSNMKGSPLRWLTAWCSW